MAAGNQLLYFSDLQQSVHPHEAANIHIIRGSVIRVKTWMLKKLFFQTEG